MLSQQKCRRQRRTLELRMGVSFRASVIQACAGGSLRLELPKCLDELRKLNELRKMCQPGIEIRLGACVIRPVAHALACEVWSEKDYCWME